MDQLTSTQTLAVTGAELMTAVDRLLQAGVSRLQVLSPTGSVTLVLPRAAGGAALDPRWAPVAETLARLYPTLTLRVLAG